MPGRTHSVNDHRGFRLALLATACFVLLLLSGSPSNLLIGADWLARNSDDRVEQTEAQTQTAGPLASLDVLFAEDRHEETAETTDDDETERCLLCFDVLGPIGMPALRNQAELHESSFERPLTPVRLRAFPTRGSPAA